MKTRMFLLIAGIGILTIITGCEEMENTADVSDGTGTLSLSLTDAPIDDPSVTGVYITVDSLQYHKKNNNWATFEEFDGPKTVNLLELTDSLSVLLGDFEMEAGQYNQIRFILKDQEIGQGQGQGQGRDNGGPPETPGCYIEFEDGKQEALFVPGGKTGYKATGSFRVPSNGTVDVTADFDVRKSVVKTGNGRYILKPTIRLVVNDQAGSIAGGITGLPTDTASSIIIYAYEDNEYSDSEAAEPGVEENRFSNAVSSYKVSEKDSYHFFYLAPETYDLVVTRYLNGEFEEVLGIVKDVAVQSRKTTNQPIDLSSL